MLFRFKNVDILGLQGADIVWSRDGLTVNGRPLIFGMNQEVYLDNFVIITRERLDEIISLSSDGVISREAVRKYFEIQSKVKGKGEKPDGKST